MFKWQVLLVLCLSFYFDECSSIISEVCTTPDQKPGKCVLLPDCPSINKMSNDFDTPMTIERLHFLMNSQCELKNGTLKACCSLEELANVQENYV